MDEAQLRQVCATLRTIEAKLRTSTSTIINSNHEAPAADAKLQPQQQQQQRRPSVASGHLAPGLQAPDAESALDVREYKVKVLISLTFVKITGIDTIKDRFSAEAQVLIKWREPLLDNKSLKSSDVQFDKYWNPKVMVSNNIGEIKNKSTFSLTYDNSGKANVVECRTISGTFHEFMELNLFPFDSQDLTISLSCERTFDEVELQPDKDNKCTMKPTAFKAVPEWTKIPTVTVKLSTTMKKDDQGRKTKHPVLSCSCRTTRKPHYFIYNVIMLLSVLGSFSLATFSVAQNQPQFRLQLTFFILLTCITFKSNVAKSLPKISYLTYMDKYILSIMLLTFGVCCWHATLGGIIHPLLVKVETASKTTEAPKQTGNNASSLDATSVTTSLAASSPLFLPTSTMKNQLSTTTVKPAATTTAARAPNGETWITAGSSMVTAPLTKTIDSIALGVLGSIYLTIHMTLFVAAFLALRDSGGSNDGEDGGGEEEEEEED